MLRIVFAAPHFPPRHIGGTERVVERLARRFKEKGYSIDVIAVEAIDQKGGKVICQVEDFDGINVYRLNLPEAPLENRFTWTYRNPLLGDWFRMYMDNAKPDILHFHSGYLISASMLEAALEKKLPIIVTLHDYWFICPLITLLRTNGDLCAEPVPTSRCVWCMLSEKRRYRFPDEALKGMPGVLFSKMAANEAVAKTIGTYTLMQKMEQRRSYLKKILEEVDIVTSPSRFLKTKFSDYDIYPKRFIHLPFGLEINRTSLMGEASPDETVLRIGYLGQIAHHKGVHVLLKAFQNLNVTHRKAELYIYGDGSRRPDYMALLMRIANDHPAIYFQGKYSASEVDRVLDSLDVVVVPSIWYENRPTVILEAFSRRKPVVVSNLGGMAEMVTQDVDGLNFRVGDPIDLAKKIQYILDNRDVLPRLASAIPPVKAVEDEVGELESLYIAVTENHNTANI